MFQRTHRKRADSTRHVGQQAEQQACRFLQRQGLHHVTSNYACRHGEIDLVMEHADTLVFVEVRYRGNSRHGSGAESITRHKQRKLIRTAEHFLQQHPAQANRPCRFDVVSIAGQAEKPCWLQDAFCADP
jgi:putative endonuclease